jgi:hypothetical protein
MRIACCIIKPTDTLRMCNTYCFPMAIMVTLTRFNAIRTLPALFKGVISWKYYSRSVTDEWVWGIDGVILKREGQSSRRRIYPSPRWTDWPLLRRLWETDDQPPESWHGAFSRDAEKSRDKVQSLSGIRPEILTRNPPNTKRVVTSVLRS